MEKGIIWESMHETEVLLGNLYGPSMDQAAESFGLTRGVSYTVILTTHLIEPDPISAARLCVRNPYFSPSYYQTRIESALASGFIVKAPEGGFLPNSRGQEAFRAILSAIYQKMENINAQVRVPCNELRLILARLVQASIVSNDQPIKWGILHSRRLDPGRESADMVAVDQYLSDLGAYRDDVHLASWRELQIGGHAWDILGLVWQKSASSVAEILEKTQRRCWSEPETRAAVDELIARKWITYKEPFALTEEGLKVREEAERLTNLYFFSPWTKLSDPELRRLGELLDQLKKELSEMQ